MRDKAPTTDLRTNKSVMVFGRFIGTFFSLSSIYDQPGLLGILSSRIKLAVVRVMYVFRLRLLIG